MTRVVRMFFIMLLCTFFLIGTQTSYSQLYDGPVGNNAIPSTYEGFDQAQHPSVESATSDAPGGDPCEFQDPFNPICPIDDWVYVLLFLGVGYGFVKFRKHKVPVV